MKNNENAQCAAPTRSENDRGNKQNKVRFFGTPSNIFKEFASKEDDSGALAMSYEEFFESLCPYNYQKPRKNDHYFKHHGQQIDRVLSIADVDKDGMINF